MAKKSTHFDYERASRALAVAALEGDHIAAQREGITVRTIHNYRVRLTTDKALSELFHEKKARLETEWAHQIAPTLRAALQFLQRAMTSLDPSDPEAVHAAAGAYKLINEGHLTMKVIDARLAEQHPAHHPQPGEMAASARVVAN